MRIRDALRALLVGVGVFVVAVAIWSLVTLPPPPPSGRDIPGGFAIIFMSLAVLAGLFIAIAGLVIGGDDDPVFHGYQRTVLQLVGYFLGGSLVVAVGVFLTVDPLVGLIVPGVAAVLALPVALAVVCWRAGEAVVRFSRRATD